MARARSSQLRRMSWKSSPNNILCPRLFLSIVSLRSLSRLTSTHFLSLPIARAASIQPLTRWALRQDVYLRLILTCRTFPSALRLDARSEHARLCGAHCDQYSAPGNGCGPYQAGDAEDRSTYPRSQAQVADDASGSRRASLRRCTRGGGGASEACQTRDGACC